MAVFAATPRSTRIFLSLAAASELKWIRGDDSRRAPRRRRRRCCGASCKGELCCCVKRCCLKAGVPPLTCCESFVDKEVCCQCGLCCCALGCKCPSTCIKHQGQCCCVVNNIACPCDEEVPLTCALCFFACHPVGVRRPSLPRLAAHATSRAALRHLRAHQRSLAVPSRAGRRAARGRGHGRQGGGLRRRGAARQRVGGRVPRVARRRRRIAGKRRHAVSVHDGTLDRKSVVPAGLRGRRPDPSSPRPLPPTSSPSPFLKRMNDTTDELVSVRH